MFVPRSRDHRPPASFGGAPPPQRGRRSGQRMRRVISMLRQESGMALVMALGMMAVLSTLAATLFAYTSSNSRNASRSDKKQKAYVAAEAGINRAVAVLGLGTNNALDPCLLHPPTNPSGTTCASNAPF